MDAFEHIGDDGTHVVPVTKIKYGKSPEFENATGEIRWHPSTGGTFRFLFAGLAKEALSKYYTSPASGSVGKIVENSSECFSCATLSGNAIKMQPLRLEPIASVTNSNGNVSYNVELVGDCGEVNIQFGLDDRLALRVATDLLPRVFFLSNMPFRFGKSTEIQFQEGDWLTTSNRACSLLEGDERYGICVPGRVAKLLKGVFVTLPDVPLEEQNVYAIQCFFSFLNGIHCPPLYYDYLEGDLLHRRYFGWNKVRVDSLDSAVSQPIPISDSIVALQMAAETGNAIPRMLQKFLELSETIDIGWIMTPLWASGRVFIDDKVALASLTIERFCSQIQKTQKAEESLQKPWKTVEIAQIKKELLSSFEKMVGCLDAEVISEHQTQIDIARKNIDNNVFRLPNQKKYEEIFRLFLGQLLPNELRALKQRNLAFHGSRTVNYKDFNSLNLEIEIYDTLRVLVHKAILKLVEYRGKIIDYSSRPNDDDEFAMIDLL